MALHQRSRSKSLRAEKKKEKWEKELNVENI